MAKGFFTIFGDYDALQEALKRAELPPDTIAIAEVIDDDAEMAQDDFETVGKSAGVAVWRGIQEPKDAA